MKYYFFKSVVEKKTGKLRVNPLENQIDSTGNAINTTFNVQCNKSVRESYPESTIFFGTDIKLSSSGKYYTTKGFNRLTKTSPKNCLDEYKKLTGTEYTEKETSTLFTIISTDKTLVPPTSTKDGFYMTTNDWKLLVRNIKRHINTMIIGMTGCGKTSCVKEVCDRMGVTLHIFDMGSMIDPISSLLGVHRLEDGHSIFDMAKFTKVIQEPCVILLDELNRASVGSNNVLFPCLDDRRELNIEIAGSKDIRSIKVHPEVTFIATANIGNEYTGTMSMDRALVNRFFPIELGYIPSAEESNVLVKRTGIDKTNADLIVKIANNIRSLASKQEISQSLSIRETLMVGNLVHDGWDIGNAMNIVYLPLFEGTDSEGERGTVKKTILSY